MNARRLELAVKKHRLQMRSAALRSDLSAYAAAWQPAFAIADQARAALLWLRRHPAVPVAVGVALLVARPRLLLRWLKRGFFAWQTFTRVRNLLPARPPLTR